MYFLNIWYRCRILSMVIKMMTILFGQCNMYKVCFIKTGSYVTQMLT